MKHYETMTGYKATDKDMKCCGFQFEVGKWYEHEGELSLCHAGFHFCKYPSGPWSYYNDPGTRVFKVEARNVHEQYTPGSDLKMVCSKIRLIEEIIPVGNSNTGNSNTGNWNAGYWNAGNWNATDRCAGFFCAAGPRVLSFDEQTELTQTEFLDKYPTAFRLGEMLAQDAPFDYSEFTSIPGWTLAKCQALHQRHIAGRKVEKEEPK